MSPCNSPSSPSQSLREQLFWAHDTAMAMIYPTDVAKLVLAYDQVRNLLFLNIEQALDPYPYTLSWGTLTRFGDAAKDRLVHNESPEDFTHLQDTIKQAVELLP